MSILDIFKSKAAKIWALIKLALFSDSNKAKHLQMLIEFILPVAENLTKMDWNNDGVLKHSREEIVANFKSSGIKYYDWVTAEVVKKLPAEEIKRYLIISKVALEWSSKNLPLPEWSKSLVNTALELVVRILANNLTKSEALKLVRGM